LFSSWRHGVELVPLDLCELKSGLKPGRLEAWLAGSELG
jgi:hypothetical protein